MRGISNDHASFRDLNSRPANCPNNLQPITFQNGLPPIAPDLPQKCPIIAPPIEAKLRYRLGQADRPAFA